MFSVVIFRRGEPYGPVRQGGSARTYSMKTSFPFRSSFKFIILFAGYC